MLPWTYPSAGTGCWWWRVCAENRIPEASVCCHCSCQFHVYLGLLSTIQTLVPLLHWSLLKWGVYLWSQLAALLYEIKNWLAWDRMAQVKCPELERKTARWIFQKHQWWNWLQAELILPQNSERVEWSLPLDCRFPVPWHLNFRRVGIAQLTEHQTPDWKVTSSISGRSRRIFFSRLKFLCWLLFLICSTPLLPQ